MITITRIITRIMITLPPTTPSPPAAFLIYDHHHQDQDQNQDHPASNDTITTMLDVITITITIYVITILFTTITITIAIAITIISSGRTLLHKNQDQALEKESKVYFITKLSVRLKKTSQSELFPKKERALFLSCLSQDKRKGGHMLTTVSKYKCVVLTTITFLVSEQHQKIERV